MIDTPQDDVNRFAPSEATVGIDGSAPQQSIDHAKIERPTLASSLAAYALNLAHGAILQPFELDHLIELAGIVGCKVTPKHLSYVATRVVLEELLVERRAQIEVHGYTLEYDDANPEHAHDQVLERANQFPSVHTRKDLVELAAIAVAEIERLDRLATKVVEPAPLTITAEEFAAQPEPRKIITCFVNPPIPIRTSDWCAYYEGSGEIGPVGWAATEVEAIDDLRAQDVVQA